MAQLPIKRQTRIEKLKSLEILDTEIEAEFEAITQVATYICDTPISLISLIEEDRQWYKSARGVGDLKETPIKHSICVNVINDESGEMAINDLREDERFADNPFVVNNPNIQSYTGVSIETSDGHRLGTLCVIDTKPRTLTEAQLNCIRVLADYTVKLIELRNSNHQLEEHKNDLLTANNDLEQYAYAIAHDIKAPLRIMSSFTNILLRKAGSKLSKEEKEYLYYIVKSAKELSNYTQNLLQFSRNIQINTETCTFVNLNQLMDDLNIMLNPEKQVMLLYDSNLPHVFVAKTGLQQILKNLISNSIRYRDTEAISSFIGFEIVEKDDVYEFTIVDNGIGISEERQATLFNLFIRNKMIKESTGIGLSVVQRLVKKMGGELHISSKLGKGTTVKFTIKRID
ncbi:MAG: ATP-binding protein [Saprospiraceae bacterium]